MIIQNFQEPFSEQTEIPPFTHTFTDEEIKLLAKFLRNNQNQLPAGMENFARKVELYIYSSMSIDEVEKFYS